MDRPQAEGGEGVADPAISSGVLARGSVYSIVTVVQAAMTLLAIPVLTRLLDAEEYGLLTAVLVSQAVITHLAGFGMPAAVTRTYFRDGGPDSARALICVAAGVAVAVGVVACASGPLWSQVFGSLDFGPELALAVAAAVASATLVSAQTLLQAEGRARSFVVSAAIAIGGGQALGIAAVALGFGPTGYMAGLTVGFAAALAFAWPAAGFETRPLRPGAGGRELIERAFRIGVPTIAMGLSLYLLSGGDRIIVERVAGAADAGSYYIAYAVGSLGIFLASAINGAWSPAIFAAEEEGRWAFLADSAVEIARLIAFAAAALSLAAPIALKLFAPPDYELAGLGDVSTLVALSTLPFLLYVSGANLSIWRARTGRLAVSSAICVVLNLGLCAVLVRSHGLEGAAAATLLAYLVLGSLTWLWTRRLATIPWDRRRLLLATSPAFAGAMLALALPDDGAWLALRGVLAVGAGLMVISTVLAERRQMID